MPARVELRDLRKSFGDVEIIKGMDFTIEPGEFIVFVGPSGCGKSTLLRLIAGLEDITSGDLLFDDRVVNDEGPAQRGVGMVFQSYALYPHMTVEQNVGFGLKLAKKPPQEISQRVSEALKTLQLDHLKDRKPSDLSGGQRQRVAIGRAIVRNPNVFLFDEPLSNLDTALRVQMRMEIGRLHRRLMNTVIYVTHDQVEAMTLADRFVVLEGGKTRQIGPPLELYERPANKFVAGFIGTPKMGFLAIQHAEKTNDGMAITLGGENAEPNNIVIPLTAEGLNTNEGLTLGIRPEHCRLVDSEQGLLKGEVLELERLGADTFVFIATPSAEEALAVRLDTPDRKLAPGDMVGIEIDPTKALLFDEKGDVIELSQHH